MLKPLLITLIISLSLQTYSQFLNGDAGLYSTGSLIGRSRPVVENYGFLKIASGFCIDNKRTSIFTQEVEGNRIFYSHIGSLGLANKIQIKVPYKNIRGSLGNVSGLGDIVVSYSLEWFFGANPGGFGLVGGAKIATNNSNVNALPMMYQTSLGTHDFILGAFVTGYSWNYVAGYQRPIKHVNNNEFLGNGDYKSSNGLRRAGDIMLKVERRFQFTKSVLTFGVVNFYHLGDDKIIDSSTNAMVKVRNTTNYSLNLTAKSYFYIFDRINADITFAIPIIGSKQRFDGLSRTFSVAIALSNVFLK